MPNYLLTMIQPDGPPPAPEVLEDIMTRLHALNDEIAREGGWVFTGGLTPPESATVLRASGGEVVMTDGPYTEAKEHVGGLHIVAADDLDGATRWARRIAEITTLPVEVRAFQA